MTIIPVKCPYCGKATNVIIEALDAQTYDCSGCGEEFIVKSSISVHKNPTEFKEASE